VPVLLTLGARLERYRGFLDAWLADASVAEQTAALPSYVIAADAERLLRWSAAIRVMTVRTRADKPDEPGTPLANALDTPAPVLDRPRPRTAWGWIVDLVTRRRDRYS
jgi:hypothetical protein